MDAIALTLDEDKDPNFREQAEEVFKKYYEPLQQPSNWPILTSKELDDRFTSRFDSLAEFLRGHVVKSNFGTQSFLDRQAKIEESEPPDPMNGLIELFSNAGMTKADHLYLARRGGLYFYLIEENGELRMLSFTNRIRSSYVRNHWLG
jgi:hypothetical protein